MTRQDWIKEVRLSKELTQEEKEFFLTEESNDDGEYSDYSDSIYSDAIHLYLCPECVRIWDLRELLDWTIIYSTIKNFKLNGKLIAVLADELNTETDEETKDVIIEMMEYLATTKELGDKVLIYQYKAGLSVDSNKVEKILKANPEFIF